MPDAEKSFFALNYELVVGAATGFSGSASIHPPTHLKLETVEAVDVGRRCEERSVRGRGKLDQKLWAGGVNGRQLLATTAEFQDNWISRIVPVIDGYVILHNKNKCTPTQGMAELIPRSGSD